jgi:hypothetical protein
VVAKSQAMFGYTQQGNANFYKFVTLDRDGETMKVKLRRYNHTSLFSFRNAICYLILISANL